MHSGKITEGVSCAVNSCHYYKDGNLCTAGRIEIKPKDAKSLDETDCATFVNHSSLN